jgi:hypothetical protein
MIQGAARNTAMTREEKETALRAERAAVDAAEGGVDRKQWGA